MDLFCMHAFGETSLSHRFTPHVVLHNIVCLFLGILSSGDHSFERVSHLASSKLKHKTVVRGLENCATQNSGSHASPMCAPCVLVTS